MSATLDRLIYTANQIALNLAREPDPAAATAEHLRKYWDPRMKDLISKHLNGGGGGLNATATDAVRRLRLSREPNAAA